jgi:small subunit ribosomal protein S16
MAVVIRLARYGTKSKPFYRLVVADKRFCKEGRHLEVLGTFDPKSSALNVKKERVAHWISNGALPSETVNQLLKKSA